MRQDGGVSKTSAEGALEDTRNPNEEGLLYFMRELSAERAKSVRDGVEGSPGVEDVRSGRQRSQSRRDEGYECPGSALASTHRLLSHNPSSRRQCQGTGPRLAYAVWDSGK